MLTYTEGPFSYLSAVGSDYEAYRGSHRYSMHLRCTKSSMSVAYTPYKKPKRGIQIIQNRLI